MHESAATKGGRSIGGNARGAPFGERRLQGAPLWRWDPTIFIVLGSGLLVEARNKLLAG